MKTANIKATLIDFMGSDLSVVNAARVSFDKESEWEYDTKQVMDEDEFGKWLGSSTEKIIHSSKRLSSKDAKLINYLAKHKHHSPFNHAFLSFRVKAPIFVARQLVKHKFMPWNEISRRYVDDEPEFYFPDYWRAKAENVKQGSSNDIVGSSDYIINYDCSVDEKELCEASVGLYKQKLKDGCCPEQARMVLPQNTMTEWYWSGTLGAFLDMLVLRLDNHTQKETREVAKLIANEVKMKFPQSYAAYLGEN
jgi:thymidylate synthase (FAD)